MLPRVTLRAGTSSAHALGAPAATNTANASIVGLPRRSGPAQGSGESWLKKLIPRGPADDSAPSAPSQRKEGSPAAEDQKPALPTRRGLRRAAAAALKRLSRRPERAPATMGKGAMGRPSLHSQHEQLLPTKQLRAVVLKMHEAFPRLCAAWNEENAMRKNWALLFSRLDTDGSGRLDYWEFRRALIDVLEISITEKEAKGLWAYVDHDKSGLVSIKEFQHACYLLILDDWPRLDRRTLTRLCGIINDAAVHEYSKEGDGTSSGNWFKIFGHFDTDESGRLGWEELEQVSRRRDPGLNLSEEKITLNELRGLWRAIDIDCSGDVTVDEFMHFMKKNATQQSGLFCTPSGAERLLQRKKRPRNRARTRSSAWRRR